ncbi:hypothetical protein VNO77_00051 [Canavalia gladiata]|uniref:Uncharacterized protein n=1 Tax=Canavalia gladiata TaxID=3824 RepID=A0AAN9R106_CANGL
MLSSCNWRVEICWLSCMAPAAHLSRMNGYFDPRSSSLEMPTRFNFQFNGYVSAKLVHKQDQSLKKPLAVFMGRFGFA